jgi:spore germination cell wall hydrolase CwlJ-like protein
MIKYIKYIVIVACCLFITNELQQVKLQSRNTSGFLTENRLENQKQEKQCLVEVLWYEARGEGYLGMHKVMSVIYNRKHSSMYPSTYCDIVQQHKQFSYRNHLTKGTMIDFKPLGTIEIQTYTQVSNLVDNVLNGAFKPSLKPPVMWYAHKKVSNRWTKKKIVVEQVGKHNFYAKSKV